MAHETDLRKTHFIEGSTPRITYTLKDEAGAVITGALTTQTASIYDEATGTVIGTDPDDWENVDIDGAEGNAVVAGVGTWDLPASATAKIGSDTYEDHIIAMKFTYGVGRVGKHWIKVRVYEQPVGS
jgi:hypothetical protein